MPALSNTEVETITRKQWIAVAVVTVVAVGLALSGAPIPAPPLWLDPWTDWVIKIVAVVAVPRLALETIRGFQRQ